jgi:CxxC-x17-CxxC domain-containing protein
VDLFLAGTDLLLPLAFSDHSKQFQFNRSQYMTSMQDKTLTCNDCGQAFTFTASEQEFFAQKGFSTPGRCPSCRAARKAQREGGSSYGSSYGGSSYDSPRQMFPVVCAQCGKDTEVPFKPSGDRPVYCSDCFKEHSPSRSSGGSSRSSGGSRGGGGYNSGSRW